MSTYFDAKTAEVYEASKEFPQRESFIEAVTGIENALIRDVSLVTGDREFPDDLREKAMSLIALWHVGTHGLPPRPQAIELAAICRMSELNDRMHSLFHEVASRRIKTRFGLLSDSPTDILHRRDEHDSGAA